MHPLSVIETWPCDYAAATHLNASGESASHGDIHREFALASVTKLFTAVAALLAHEEGSIDIDEPDLVGRASVADLLAHAGGLSADGKSIDEPGRRRVYSNAGYEMVAEVVAAGSGLPFGTYLQEGVFDGLGMGQTRLVGSPAHGAVSTVHDLERFLAGLPSLLAPVTYKRMTSPHIGELIGVLPGYGRKTPNPWGLGPEIRGSKTPHWTGSANSEQTWGHFGQAGTFVWTDPANQQRLIVLTDRPFGDWALPLWPELSDALLRSPNSRQDSS